MATDSDRARNGAVTPGVDGHRGVIELARTALEDTVRLVQLEIQLARLELMEMLKANVRAVILLAVAGLCVLLALIMALVWLALLLPNHALTAAIEAIVLVLVGAILVLAGWRSLKISAPPRTMTSLKEDAEWAKHLLKRNAR